MNDQASVDECRDHVEHRFDRATSRRIGLHPQLNEWQPCPEPELDPWFSETAEIQERAEQLYNEALGEQLIRGFMSGGRSDMVRQLVRDLFRAGFTMHDCRGAFGKKHEGGVCLVPLTEGGMGVSWAQHDVSYGDFGHHQDVQEACNDWLRDLMTVLGWRTEDFGTAGAFRVTGKLSEPAPSR